MKKKTKQIILRYSIAGLQGALLMILLIKLGFTGWKKVLIFGIGIMLLSFIESFFLWPWVFREKKR